MNRSDPSQTGMATDLRGAARREWGRPDGAAKCSDLQACGDRSCRAEIHTRDRLSDPPDADRQLRQEAPDPLGPLRSQRWLPRRRVPPRRNPARPGSTGTACVSPGVVRAGPLSRRLCAASPCGSRMLLGLAGDSGGGDGMRHESAEVARERPLPTPGATGPPPTGQGERGQRLRVGGRCKSRTAKAPKRPIAIAPTNPQTTRCSLIGARLCSAAQPEQPDEGDESRQGPSTGTSVPDDRFGWASHGAWAGAASP